MDEYLKSTDIINCDGETLWVLLFRGLEGENSFLHFHQDEDIYLKSAIQGRSPIFCVSGRHS